MFIGNIKNAFIELLSAHLYILAGAVESRKRCGPRTNNHKQNGRLASHGEAACRGSSLHIRTRME